MATSYPPWQYHQSGAPQPSLLCCLQSVFNNQTPPAVQTFRDSMIMTKWRAGWLGQCQHPSNNIFNLDKLFIPSINVNSCHWILIQHILWLHGRRWRLRVVHPFLQDKFIPHIYTSKAKAHDQTPPLPATLWTVSCWTCYRPLVHQIALPSKDG